MTSSACNAEEEWHKERMVCLRFMFIASILLHAGTVGDAASSFSAWPYYLTAGSCETGAFLIFLSCYFSIVLKILLKGVAPLPPEVDVAGNTQHVWRKGQELTQTEFFSMKILRINPWIHK